MKRLNLIIVGTGMYVCGKGTEDYGTIIPAIYEWKRGNSLGDLYICGTAPEGIRIARRKLRFLEHVMGMHHPIGYFPEGNERDIASYKKAISRIRKPAACIVAVPDHLHSEVAGYAIRSGLHTLVVKPLVSTMKELEGLLRLQAKHDVYCAVEFHKRFDHANVKLKDILAGGAIGDSLYFLSEFSQRKDIPEKHFKKWVANTDVFQYLGIHYADIIYFVTGAIPQRVMAIGQKNWLLSHGINTYDSIQAMIEWKAPGGKQFSSSILTNWIDPRSTSAMSDQKIKVIGTKGRFESDQKNRGITMVSDERGIEEPNPYFCASYGATGSVTYRGYGIDSVKQFLSDVYRIENGELRASELEGKRPTFKQSIVPTAILEGVNKSLKNGGRWIDVRIKR